MKRFILMAAAAALLAIPAAEAQKVNKEATLSKLEKSDADIANPKKNAKAATWINRGRVYYDAAAEPTANLFAPMETTLLKLSVGDPTSTEEVTLNGSKAICMELSLFHRLRARREDRGMEAVAGDQGRRTRYGDRSL